MTETETLAIDKKKHIIVEAIKEKKGHNVITIDLSQVQNSISDCFIICHGDSDTQVSSITEAIEKKLKEEASIRAHHIEGTQNNQWVLMDYFDVLVHVFLKEHRYFYNLEELWADGIIERIEDEQ